MINGDCAVSGINNWSEWPLEFIFQAHICYSNLGTVPIRHDFRQFHVLRPFFKNIFSYVIKERNRNSSGCVVTTLRSRQLRLWLNFRQGPDALFSKADRA